MSTSPVTSLPVDPAVPGAAGEPARRPSRSGLAALALVGIAAIWGSTFPLLHGIVQLEDPADLLAVRFAIAAGTLLLVAPRAVLGGVRRVLRSAVPLGVLYGTGQVLQTVGLRTTPASVSGFVTGLYVVLTPVLGALVARRLPQARVAVAAVLATAGLAVLSLRGLAVGGGELLTAASAFVYALHILGLSRWSRPEDVYASSFVQMLVAAALCTVAALPGGIGLPQDGGSWLAMLYLAVAAGSLAIIAQTWAQAHLPAARAAIIMTMEPVWASTFAVLLGGEVVSGRLLAGGALVLAAMALAEVPLRSRRRRRERGEHAPVPPPRPEPVAGATCTSA